MVRLRGHHLVCLFFFEGNLGDRGYSSNRENILARVEKGEPVKIIGGADDLCGRCPYLAGLRCTYKEEAEEEIAQLDRKAVEHLGFSVGATILWRDAAQRVIDAPGTWFSQFCDKCDWVANCRRGCHK